MRVAAAILCVWTAATGLLSAPAQGADTSPIVTATDPAVEQKLLGRIAALRREGRFAEARDLAEGGLAVAERNLGPNDPHVARFLSQLGLTEAAEGNNAEGEAHLKRALAIYEKTPGPQSSETGQALADLGAFYVDQGRYGEAEPMLKRALAIAEKTRGPDHDDTAAALTALGILYSNQGRSAEAEPLLKRVLAIDEKNKGPDHPDTATSLNNLAEVYREQGRLAEAEPLYKRALATDEKDDPDGIAIATDLANLALLCQAMERYDEAERLHRRAIDIRERKLGEHPATATALSNFATMLVEQGRFSEAEPLSKRALAINDKVLGPGHPDTALANQNLGALYRQQGRRAEALPLYERALAIFEKRLGPDHPLTALALNNLADAYRDEGRFAEAEKMFKRAFAIDAKTLPPDHPRQIASTANLAGVYLAWGRYADAEPLFRKALALVEKTLPKDHPQIGMAFYWLSRTLLEQKRYEEALGFGRRAVAILSATQARGVARELSGGWQAPLVYDDIFALQARVAYALATQKPAAAAALRAEAFELLQRVGFDSTGRAVAMMASRFAAKTDALAQLLREQQILLRRLPVMDKQLAIALGASDPATRAQTGALRAESERISARLKEIDATLRRDHQAYADLADPKPVSLAETQSLLKDNEAIVILLPLQEATFMLAVSRSDVTWNAAPVRTADLIQSVTKLRRALDPDQWQTRPLEPFDRTLAHRLYTDLWSPFDQVVKDKGQVFVITDGPLTSLPFGVLVSDAPQDGTAGDANPQALRDTAWLIKRHALTTLPSISSLKALRVYANKSTGSEPFAGFGDPVLVPAGTTQNARGLAVAFRGAEPDTEALRRLPPLPATANELKALAKALGASEMNDVYLRDRATEARVKTTDLSKKRVIAFATHGLMAGDAGLGEPGLVFTPPATATADDNGYLSASEAASLDLKAEWIILSACNTAAGDTPGAKGLSGLARAFFLAGAKSLLVSHWAVWDDAAMKLTAGTVANMTKAPAAGRAEALRQSMLAVMNDVSVPRFAHPAAWAPFVLVGETQP